MLNLVENYGFTRDDQHKFLVLLCLLKTNKYCGMKLRKYILLKFPVPMPLVYLVVYLLIQLLFPPTLYYKNFQTHRKIERVLWRCMYLLAGFHYNVLLYFITYLYSLSIPLIHYFHFFWMHFKISSRYQYTSTLNISVCASLIRVQYLLRGLFLLK